MLELFRGRTDIYFDEYMVEAPLTEEVLDAHYEGTKNIGVYPVVDGHCWWGCADIDDGSFDAALRFAHTADQLGVTGWIERSKSKGYHVWIFANEAVPVGDMRDAMTFIDRMSSTHIPELNPKGDGKNGEIVNCVRIPFSGASPDDRQQMVDSDDEIIDPAEFVEEAMALRVSAEAFADLAARQRLWAHARTVVAPKTERTHGRRRTARSETNAARAFRGERMIPMGERDDTFWALANYLMSPNSLNMSATDAEVEVTRVWETMTEQKETYPLQQALRKLSRI